MLCRVIIYAMVLIRPNCPKCFCNV